MKKLYAIALVAIFTIGLFNSNLFAENDSIQMGAGYANDIYYSMAAGEVQFVSRTNWDIGFFTNAFSDGIITNDGNGVTLYTYPNADTSGWETVDTTGLAEWSPMFNSTGNWETGAFNRNASGHPDYGWGIYNSITHDLVGDSLFIIILADGSAKKLWMQRKQSIASTFYFKYANLDGSDEVDAVVDCSPYADKNFIYYSMMDQVIVDREPNMDDWDILFTKYMEILQGNTPYPVTGVVNNINVPANRFDEVGSDFENWSSMPFDSTKTAIGYDWKEFNMTIFAYEVDDSVAFFVSDKNTDVYKITFSVFDYTNGKVVFDKMLISPANTKEVEASDYFGVYPNPAKNYLTIQALTDIKAGFVQVLNMSGNVVIGQPVSDIQSTINLNNLSSGMYLLRIYSGDMIYTQKILIQ